MCTVSIVTFVVILPCTIRHAHFIYLLFFRDLQRLMFVSILVLWTAMSMLTVWILWEIMSVTVLQDTLEMEHTAQVRRVVFSQICVKDSNLSAWLG